MNLLYNLIKSHFKSFVFIKRDFVVVTCRKLKYIMWRSENSLLTNKRQNATQMINQTYFLRLCHLILHLTVK